MRCNKFHPPRVAHEYDFVGQMFGTQMEVECTSVRIDYQFTFSEVLFCFLHYLSPFPFVWFSVYGLCPPVLMTVSPAARWYTPHLGLTGTPLLGGKAEVFGLLSGAKLQNNSMSAKNFSDKSPCLFWGCLPMAPALRGLLIP